SEVPLARLHVVEARSNPSLAFYGAYTRCDGRHNRLACGDARAGAAVRVSPRSGGNGARRAGPARRRHRRGSVAPPGRASSAACRLAFGVPAPARAAQPKDADSDLDQKAFFKPELSISTAHVPLEGALMRLPNRAAWENLLAGRGDDPRRPALKVWLDPRSGA